MTVPDFGPKPEYAELPVAELSVDSSYQRTIETPRSQVAIAKIAAGFRWSLFEVVSVTKGLTGYLIIDGQHRVEAARRLGIKTVPCLLMPFASTREQALAFVAKNRDRVPVNPFAIFHALAAAGDEQASAVAALCADADVEIPRYTIPTTTLKPRQTLAIGALGTLLKSRGHERSVALLRAVRAAFADDRGAMRAPLISALAILDETNRIDAAAVQRVLSKTGRREFEQQCVAVLGTGDSTRTRAQAAVTVIRQLLGITGAPKPAAPPPGAKRAPVKVAPKPAAKEPEPVSEPTSADQFTVAVQRRCEGCKAVFKTRTASVRRCEQCRQPDKPQPFIKAPSKAQLMGKR